ncbi:putative Synaptobrevin [Leishmania shawi]|uniref:Synaptobrevin n=1 Tax=Leishmania shawi TaxID=5680 RepID=A0AAW3BEP5_9TRYP
MFSQTQKAKGADSGVLFPFRVGGKSTVVMSDYHICKYDAILGVLVCIGDDANVLVLGKEMCRELLPLPCGVHWLDAFVYSGTTSFLVLSSETLLCLDYSTGVNGSGDSMLRCMEPGAPFTCLHVAQGLTCGAVGRKDGSVSYFRLDPVSDNLDERPQLRWAVTETNVLGLCLPFCKNVTGPILDTSVASRDKFFITGSLISMDSYPNNPNALIGVVGGVPGVCKWYIDEGRVSCFFDAHSIVGQPDGHLAACRVTPGGVYVAAVTMHCTKILLWNESKKRRDKVAELYWVVDLSQQISQGVPDAPSAGLADAFSYNEYRVGLNMARTSLDSFYTTNDKHSQMYMLLHGQRDILEVVIRLDDKQVMRQDAVIAHLNAYTAQHGVEAARTKGSATGSGGNGIDAGANTVENYFNVFHVEPCVLSNYWTSGLADVDLEALFVTSEDGLRPILAKRNRQTGGIESIRELRELSPQAPWYPRALLLHLPENQIRSLAEEIQRTAVTSTWEKLLRGGDTLLRHALPDVEAKEVADSNVAHLWRQSVMVTVTDAAQAVCLSPQSNEVFSVNSQALANCVPWSTLAIGQDADGLVLEAALPSLHTVFLPTEIILRVFSTESIIMIMKYDIRRNAGSLVLNLDRAALQLDGHGVPGKRMVQQAVIVNARLEPSTVTDNVSVYKDGKCVLLLLEDSSVALVDLSGKDDNGRPFILQVPVGLLPVGSTIASLDAFWMASQTAMCNNKTGLLCLACLFMDGKGFLLWNLSEMRLITYAHPAYATFATRLMVTAAAQPLLPNLSGDIKMFEVALSISSPVQNAGEYGSLTCCDALGAALMSMSLAFGVADCAPQAWCYRQSAEVNWVALPQATSATKLLLVRFEVSGSSLEWAITVGGAAVATGNSALLGSIVHVKTTWTPGKANLTYDTDAGEMRDYEISRDDSANDHVAPAIAFVGAHEIAVVQLSAFFPATASLISTAAKVTAADAVPVATCRLDPARRLEHFSVYHGRGALIVVTRDANGWRWVNILDSRTAKPMMQSYATLDFAGEENVQVLLVEIENVLHLYFLGASSGVVGHFFVEANLGASKASGVRKHPCFCGPRYHFTPCTFRGYGRYLPPAPTLKQETGFFKRLMTLPWEEIALRLESETLRATKATGAAKMPAGNTPATATPVLTPCASSISPLSSAPPVAKPDPKREQQEPLGCANRGGGAALSTQGLTSARQPGALAPTAAASAPTSSEPPRGRYAQLKAIAERENVSLTEARRMMSENVRKLQQRGERLSEMRNKSAELAQAALTFQDLARQLKEKQRSSWL